MATVPATTPRPESLGLLHAAATCAAVVLFLFILLWASAASGAIPPVMRALFGPMGAGSPTALAIGAVCALVMGALIGLLVAVFYNFFRFLAAVRSVEHG